MVAPFTSLMGIELSCGFVCRNTNIRFARSFWGAVLPEKQKTLSLRYTEDGYAVDKKNKWIFGLVEPQKR
jgi:hypothetical protein